MTLTRSAAVVRWIAESKNIQTNNKRKGSAERRKVDIMRRSNSKEAMEAIKNAIIESYEAAEEYYTYCGKEAKTDYNDICKDILTAFENEKVKYDCQYRAGRVSKYNLFCDWMAGLATALPASDDIFLGSAVDWLADILDETEEEKDRYTEEKAESTACYLLYRELTKHATKSKN